MKKCPRCGETKPTDAFHQWPSRHDGLSVYCDNCLRLRRRAFRQTEKGREAIKRWTRNPKNLEAQRRWRKEHPDEYRAYMRERYVWLYAPGRPRHKKQPYVRKEKTPEQHDSHLRASRRYYRRPDIRQKRMEHYMNRSEKRTDEDRRRAREYQRRIRRQKDPERARREAARLIVNLMVLHGWRKKQPCEICGTIDPVEAHHPSYDDPLSVQWLCRVHHHALHVRERDAARGITPSRPLNARSDN